MTTFWDLLPAPSVQAGAFGDTGVPKQPLPPDFYLRGDPNPLVRTLSHPDYKRPDPSRMRNAGFSDDEIDASVAATPAFNQPPLWARETVVDLLRPILDAGQYLGGLMAGNVPFRPGEAVQEAVKLGLNIGGPELAAGAIAGGGARSVARAPASEAARLARADALGFHRNMPLYHGSAASFSAFDTAMRGTMSGTPVAMQGVSTSPGP